MAADKKVRGAAKTSVTEKCVSDCIGSSEPLTGCSPPAIQ